jgi:hypothetical protein
VLSGSVAGLVGRPRPGYEDWYLVEDWTALGILRQTAVSAGHRTVHDDAARRAGPNAGAVYLLDEGKPILAGVVLAVWVTPSRHRPQTEPVALLLADGLRPEQGGLWRRELSLGPAPEYCLLAGESPPGLNAGRLPEGWSAQASPREPVWAA